jgi:fructose-bisphosphate aldolase class II
MKVDVNRLIEDDPGKNPCKFSLRAGKPVVVGVSEGERDFVGVKQVAALVRSLRDEYGCSIFLNADHTQPSG